MFWQILVCVGGLQMNSMFLFLVNRVTVETNICSFNASDPGHVHPLPALFNLMIVFIYLFLSLWLI